MNKYKLIINIPFFKASDYWTTTSSKENAITNFAYKIKNIGKPSSTVKALKSEIQFKINVQETKMKLTTKQFKQLVTEEVKRQLITEKFGDIAEFTVGAERDGNSMNIQMTIHGKTIVSKTVPLNSKLYEKLFDICKANLK